MMFLLGVCAPSTAQMTFSEIYDPGSYSSTGIAVATDEGAIYTVSIAQGRSANQSPIHFMKFDLRGEVIWEIEYRIDATELGQDMQRHIELRDGALHYIVSPSSGEDRAPRRILISLTDAQLLADDRLEEFTTNRAFVAETSDFDMNAQGDYAIAQSSIDLLSENPRFDVLLETSTDRLRYSAHDSGIRQFGSQVEWSGEDTIIAMGTVFVTDPIYDSQLRRYTAIKTFDRDLVKLDEIRISPYGSNDTIEDLIEDFVYNQGNVVYGTSELITQSRLGFPVIIARPVVRKISQDGEVVWSSNLDIDSYHSTDNRIRTVLRSHGDEAYLVAGTYTNRDDRFDPVDTVRYETLGYLVKLDEDGEIVWKRYYRHPHPDTIATQEIMDLAKTSDGGYVMTGGFQKRAPEYLDSIVLSTWLLKVDSFGCLIPGCQELSTSTKDFRPNAPLDVLISPNPASDQMVIYQGSDERIHYQLLTSSGQIVEEFFLQIGGLHQWVNVSHLPAGQYYLRMVDERGKVRSRKVVIVR